MADGDQKRPLYLDPRLQIICAVAMMSMMGSSVIAPALPAIQKALDIPVEKIGLLVTAFSLPGVFIIPITGVLADRFGKRVIIVPLLFLYGIAGALGSLASDFETLLALRFLAGLGSGSLSALSLVLIGDHFRGGDRTTALGYRIAGGQSANGLFPLIGGTLALLGWQFPFLLYILAIPVGLVALAVLDDRPAPMSSSLGTYGRDVWLCLTRFRIASLLSVAPALMIVNQGVFITFFPLFMEDAFAASSSLIGLVLSVRVISGAVVASQVGRLARRFGEARLVVGAFLVLALAVGSVPLVPNVWGLALSSFLFGLSSGVGFPAYQSLLVGAVSAEMRGAAMSANGVTNRLGQALGPIIASAFFVAGGMQAVFFSGALFLLAMALFLGLALRRSSRTGN